jgi:hypothetical protein
MKNLLFTSTLFLIFNFSFAQTKIENDLSKYGLKGKVSFFSESKYDLVEKFDGLKGKVSFFSESRYQLVEKFGEIEKGSLWEKYTYKYDVKGNKIEEIIYNTYGNLELKTTYKYDENFARLTRKKNIYLNKQINKSYEKT